MTRKFVINERSLSRWREKRGCKNPETRICWCNICRQIDKEWNDGIKETISILEQLAETKEPSPQQDAIKAVIFMFKQM